ncbi:MAG: winged helix-turn-helix domain-containing protein [Steroidobacteraceae bacterium]
MPNRLVIGEFEIDVATRRLRRRGGEPLHLANRPFHVLLHLVANRDRLVPRAELLEQFWDGRDVYEDALTRCVSTVRKALEDQGPDARYIETRWAGGYRFIGPCQEARALTAQGGRHHARYSPSVEAAAADRLVSRGNAYLGRFGLRNQRYALEMFRRALAVSPDDFRAWAGIAASHSLQFLHAEPTEEHWDSAIDAAAQALDRNPVSAESQLARAHVAVMRGNYAEADTAFALAEVLGPKLFRAWYYHGRGCAENRAHERAVALYEKASAANPLDCQASALSELSFKHLGLQAEARRAAQASVHAAERVLRMHPDEVRALSLGGCMLPGLSRKAEARGWTERAVALEPDEPYVNLNAACSYTLLGELDRALDFLERVPMSATGNSTWIAHDPSVDPIREHPRFHALFAQVAG